MLIRRCAWHREFHGYTIIHGVAAWRGRSVKFTDGVCKSCAGRVRIEWRVAGRDAETHSSWGSSSAPGRPRPAVLTAAILLIVAAILSIRPISDKRLGAGPDESLGDGGRAGERRDARLSGEDAPPRVSRERTRPLGKTKARPWRRHATTRTVSAPSPVPTAVVSPSPTAPVFLSIAEPAPEEEQLITAEPIQITSLPPILSRPLTTEDEFSLRVRRASLTRLSLSPPPERPRHAGLTIQGP